MRSLRRLIPIASLLAACGGGGKGQVPQPSEANAPPSSAAVTTQAKPVAGGKGPCPATGLWTECAVLDRLDRAGLAPRRDSAADPIHEAPLGPAGTRLLLGGAQLDVFIYADVPTRERDEARLDHGKFIEASAEPTLRGEATLIRNANLLAILRSRNDHQRERVSDALTAGPPQASTGTTLPASHTRK